MNKTRFCDGVPRRDLLKVGMAGLLGSQLTLPQMLQAASGDQSDVSVIILFLQGGLSTIDTLDMKPEAPAEVRGDFKPIDSVIPGIQLGEHIPMLAQQMDKFSLVRSMTHTNSSHKQADHYMLTGYHPTPAFESNLVPNNERPSHGSIISRMQGPRGSVPPYVCLPTQHYSTGAAYLGAGASPFVVNADPSSPGFSVPDLVPPMVIDSKRLGRRQQLLTEVDRFRKGTEVQANQKAKMLSVFQEKAFDLMTSAETKSAFDIEQEPVNYETPMDAIPWASLS